MSDVGQQKRAFLDFIDQAGYLSTIQRALSRGDSRLRLNLDDLRGYDPELTNNFLRRPGDHLPAFEDAVRETAASIDPVFAKQQASKLCLAVEGSFGAHHLSPRGLGAQFLNAMVCVEGIVTKCSLVRPKVARSTHYCQVTGKFTNKEYRDLTSISGVATTSAYPTKDQDGNLLQTEYGLSEYLDHQTIVLQEMPEKAPPGQLPRSVEVMLETDLVDGCKPGDRLQVAGVHRALPSKANQSGMFRTILLGNHIRQLTEELGSSAFTPDDVHNIKEFAKRKDCLQLLSQATRRV
jgi:DNA replication licensing factor MCM3